MFCISVASFVCLSSHWGGWLGSRVVIPVVLVFAEKAIVKLIVVCLGYGGVDYSSHVMTLCVCTMIGGLVCTSESCLMSCWVS